MRFLLAVALSALGALSPPPISLRARPQVALAPCDLYVEMHIPRNQDNRLLQVVVQEDGTTITSSEKQLDGENAQVVYTFWYKGLTIGEYLVEGHLLQVSGKVLSATSVKVLVAGGTKSTK